MRKPIAIFLADLHLSHTPPIARSVEEDWYAVQQGYLDQVWALAKEYKVPVICAGDIFNKAIENPEIIHFAIRQFRKAWCGFYSIPGNHDLPNHSLNEMHRSAYGVLAESGSIVDLPYGKRLTFTDFDLHPFPYGCSIVPNTQAVDKSKLHIALVHAYIHKGGRTAYQGASENHYCTNYVERLKGYNIAFFGDNHKSFEYSMLGGNPLHLINLGGFMRRKQDERNHEPSVGLLCNDGTIDRLYLDVSKDKFLDMDEAMQQVCDSIGAETFFEELQALGDAALDFSESVNKLLERSKVSDTIKQIIRTTLERARKK